MERDLDRDELALQQLEDMLRRLRVRIEEQSLVVELAAGTHVTRLLSAC